MKPTVAIIGAGLQGSTLALALNSRGYKTKLIEVRHSAIQAASLRNEGKIHLGFVYALDQDGGTRRLMLQGALTFAKIIEKYCGNVPWQKWRSSGFYYAVMADSLVDSTFIEGSYLELERMLREIQATHDLSEQYIGDNLTWFWRKVTSSEFYRSFQADRVSSLFETQEISIDPRELSVFINNQLNSSTIELNFQTKVLEANRSSHGINLLVLEDNKMRNLEADLVINCSWNDRLRLDGTLGIKDTFGGDLYRIKYQILVKPKTIERIFPVTMVQGPYGDIVPWHDGTVYLSWYPVGRTYFSKIPPTNDLLNNKEEAAEVARETLSSLGVQFPALKDAEILSSHAGVIIAKGEADVDSINSGLHSRSCVGFKDYNGWISVDTGKLTTAPLFAEQIADWIDKEY